MTMRKDLIPVGDKVVIEPEEDAGRTDTGLYLPQGVKERDRVQVGRVIKTGPGYPVPDPTALEQEPWAKTSADKYFPLQAKAGDYCVFLRDQGVEITFEKKKYVVVSHSAILVLIREASPDPTYPTP